MLPNMLLDAFFYFDLILNFVIGKYRSTDRSFVADRKEIARNYLKGWFAVDLIASLPWDVFYAHAVGLPFNGCGMVDASEVRPDDDELARPFTLLDALRFLRVLRILRAGRVVDRLDLLGLYSFPPT